MTQPVLSSQLDLLADPLSKFCQQILAFIKENNDCNQDKLFEHLKTIKLNDEDIIRILDSCAKIGCETPSESLRVFCNYVPKIDLDSNECPKSPPPNHPVIYTSRLKNIDWSSELMKLGVLFTSELATACFIRKIAEFAVEADEDELEGLLEKIYKKFFIRKNQNTQIIREMNLKLYVKAVSYISRNAPELVYNDLIEKFKDMTKMEEVGTQLLLFSDATFMFDNFDNAKQFLKSVINVFNQKNKRRQLIYLGKFIYNFIGNMLSQFESNRTDPVFIEIFKMANSMVMSNEYKVFCFPIMSLCHVFGATGENDTLMSFGTKYIFSKLSESSKTDGQILDSLTILLRGPHYETKTELKATHDNFCWELKEDEIGSIPKVVGYVKTHLDLLKDYQGKLYNFLIQVASDNLFEFYSMFKDIDGDAMKRFKMYGLQALFRTFETIFNPTSGFVSENCPSHSQDLINRIKTTVSILFKNEMDARTSEIEEPIFFCPPSFTKELQASFSFDCQNANSVCELWSEYVVNKNPEKHFPRATKELKAIAGKLTKYPAIEFKPVVSNEKKLLVSIIKVAPYLNNNIMPFNFTCRFIAHHDTEIASIAINALQVFIHLNQSFASNALTAIDNNFAGPYITPARLFIVLQAIKCLLDTFRAENIVVTSEMRSIIQKFVILGFCAHIPEIRIVALECIQNPVMAKDSNSLWKFIEKEDLEIGKLAQYNYLSEKYPHDNAKINAYDEVSFTIMLQAYYPTLYIYWIAAFGQFLINDNQPCICDVHRLINKILLSETGISECPIFALNALSLLYAISISTIPNEKLSDIIKRSIEDFADKSDHFKDYLCASLSCVNTSISDEILQGIVNELENGKYKGSPVLLRVLSYFMECISRNTDFVAQQAGEKYTSPFGKAISIIIDYAFDAKIITKADVPFTVNSEILQKPEMDQICCMFSDLTLCLQRVYNHIAFLNLKQSFGPFPLVKNVPTSVNHSAGTERMFSFLFALSRTGSSFIFSKDAQEAFAALCAISKIPDSLSHGVESSNDSNYSMFTLVVDHLREIPSEKFMTNFFRRYYIVAIQLFISWATTDYQFFAAIANQFSNGHFLNSWKISIANKFSEEEEEFATQIYKNAGSILALAFLYLTEATAQQRETAYNVIYVLSSSISLMETSGKDAKKTPNDSKKLIESIKKFKGKFRTDMSHYIFADAIDLCQVIAENIPLVGEQFVAKLIEIERDTRKRNEKEAKGKKSDSKVSEFSLDSSDVRITLSEEFVLPWMKQFVFHPESPGIFKESTEVFQVYTMYTFIEDILSISCTVPLSTSLQLIYSAIIESDESGDALNMLLIIATKNLFNDPDDEIALEIIHYLFSLQPRNVMDHFLKYTNFDAWHYYEIQTSKFEQIFDPNAFVPDNNELPLKGDKDEAFAYDYIVPIILSLLYDFLSDDRTLIKECNYQLLSFCAIQYKASKYSSKIKALLEANEIPDFRFATSVASSIISHIESWKLEDVYGANVALSNSEKKELYQYLRPWAISCGDVLSAAIALSLINLLDITIPEEDVMHLCRSIMIIARAITETSTYSIHKKNLERLSAAGFLIKVRDEIKNIKYSGMYTYLTVGLKLLEHAEKKSPKLILFIAEFLKCSQGAYSMIYNSAASCIASMLKEESVCQKIIKYKLPKGFAGIAPLICNSAHIEGGLDISYEIISLCIKNELFDFLWNGVDLAAFVVLTIPYIVAPGGHKIVKILAEDPEVGPTIGGRFAAICRHSGDLEENIRIIIEKVSTRISPYMNSILSFLSSVAKSGTNSQKETVFYLVSSIITICKNIELNNIHIGWIGELAVKVDVASLQISANKFLNTLMVNYQGDICVQRQNQKESTLEFPNIEDVLGLNINEWHRTSPTTPMPIYITDLGFIMCKIFYDLRASVEQVQAMPFTDWTDKLYRAQSAVVNMMENGGHNEAHVIKTSNELKMISFATAVATTTNQPKDNSHKKIKKNIAEVNPMVFIPQVSDFMSLIGDIGLEDAPKIFD